ncbi:MAG: hypothetical protein A3F70_06305 [Acidobacteria bacterium RIFCSPLOWO2_12_FULL_67_14]|nr:MAG: hypothetical protein A3F70_06305 [Acidobacteria bacterium RIFCSPLOWO2_12_FULL_67_14]
MLLLSLIAAGEKAPRVVQAQADPDPIASTCSVTDEFVFADRGRIIGAEELGRPVGTPVADHSLVYTADGQIRMYFLEGADGGARSALSSDGGATFTLEAGYLPGLTRPTAGPHFKVVPLADSRYRMFMGGLNVGILSYISADGRAFGQEPGVRLSNAETGMKYPSWLAIAPTGDGRYRGYFSDVPLPDTPPLYHIRSATSDDLLNWVMDDGVRIGPGAPTLTGEVHQPFPLPRADGCVTLFYFKRNYNPPVPAPVGMYYSTSTDGLTFTGEKFLGLSGGGPDVLRLTDGTYLLTYDDGNPSNGFWIGAGTLVLRGAGPADLSITKSDSPDPVVTGTYLTYTLRIRNAGPQGAVDVGVADMLPPQTMFHSCTSDGGGVCGGGSSNDRTVRFAAVDSLATRTVTLVARVRCSVADRTLINNTAYVAAATADPNTLNNLAFDTTTASNPAPVIDDVTVDKPQLWPPDHRLKEVTVAYDVSDNVCPLPVDPCSLSVSSNEPENGLGDGDVSPDWEIVDSTHVRLRAERSGTGSGRCYAIAITCTDRGGDSSTRTVPVMVPHGIGPN